MKRCDHERVKKLILALSVSVLILTVVFSYLPVRGEEKIYENMIRLHVIANSDSDEDQKLKLKVRDAILDKMSEYPKMTSKSDAECSILAMTDALKARAEEVLRENSSQDPVEIELGEESYPERYYEDFTLPAGEYTSLRVVIGDGEGHNWWCVLFPPLCTAESIKEAEEDFLEVGFTGEQYKLIKNGSGTKYKVRFKILELLAEAFGLDY
ncbi:MAG: stage II sporulation protein R [Clostridia bacterium]|nr:stage II sporulation protein R [Clostridia bacterium]